jgi:predicted nucleic acid-binding protein
LVARVHLDNDFLVYATAVRGPERKKLFAMLEAGDDIEISAIAWYEYCRGPRLPEQLALAASFFGTDKIIPFDATLAQEAGEIFRRLGSPRRRAQDIAIGVTARSRDATLVTRNVRDFAGIAGLEVISASKR